MASYGRNTDDDKVQRSKELIVMGRKTRNSVYTLYVRDSNKEKRSQKASIDPGCTSCSILRIWRLWARIKMIIRWITSPHWLFEIARENFYFYCFHLVSRKGIDTPRSSRFAARDQVDKDFQKTTTKKRKANKRVPEFLVRKITSCGNFRTILLTPLLNLRVWGVDNSLF
jgi:hypothetical protein